MLKLAHISYSHGTRVILHDVTFSVTPGKLTCLVGPSGCGKSTLLRLIAGLEPLQRGCIINNNTILADTETHTPPQTRNIGVMFQHPSLFPHLSVEDNVSFGLSHLQKSQRSERVLSMLHLVGMAHKSAHYPHQLSGGQHQRVALARALAPSPSIMLLDEPFANLDHALRRDIRDDVIAILSDANIPIIMVTHDPEEALIMADQMILLHANGSIHQSGSPDAIHNAPVDIDAARFFGYINSIKGRVGDTEITSSLGPLPKAHYAPSIAAGTDITIATRPEGVRIAAPDEAAANATVEAVAHTGAGWLISCCLPEGDMLRFHHIYGTRLGIGDTIRLTYEPPHIFLFE